MISQEKTIVVIGSGPGIGRAIATLFASKRYGNVVLMARRASQLEEEKKSLMSAFGASVNIETFALDVVDSEALLQALAAAELRFGRPECIFYNAARVLPSQLFEHKVEDIEYDFKINVSSLYAVAKKELPQLVDMAKNDTSSMPSLIVTSSMLPLHPIPQLFALSLVKAAQRNLVQSIDLEYGSQGVHIGVINVGGPVSLDHPDWNPSNIATKAWDWVSASREDKSFEVQI